MSALVYNDIVEPHRPVWTPERDALALRMSAIKARPAEIAFALGLTTTAVETRLSRLRKPAPAAPVRRTGGAAIWTEAERDHLLRLVRERRPIPEIAETLGRSIGGVQTYASKIGVHLTLLHVSEGERDAIVRLAGENWRHTRIARQVGHDITVVEGVLAEDATRTAKKSRNVHSNTKLAILARHREGWTSGRISVRYSVDVATVEEVLYDAGHLRDVRLLPAGTVLPMIVTRRPVPLQPTIQDPLAGTPDTVRRVVERISRATGVRVDLIVGRSRKPAVTGARSACCYWIRRLLSVSWTVIARAFRRDHTSVIEAARRHIERRAEVGRTLRGITLDCPDLTGSERIVLAALSSATEPVSQSRLCIYLYGGRSQSSVPARPEKILHVMLSRLRSRGYDIRLVDGQGYRLHGFEVPS